MTEGDLGKDYIIIREYILKTISECQKNMVEHEIWWCYSECSCLVNMLKAETLWNTEGIDIRYERKSRSSPSESFDLACIWTGKNNFPVDTLCIFLNFCLIHHLCWPWFPRRWTTYQRRYLEWLASLITHCFCWNYLCIGLSFV